MLSLARTRALREAARSGANRNAAAAGATAAKAPATKAGGADFPVVKCVSEDPADVAAEVPHFNYYCMPRTLGDHKYKSLSLREQLFKGDEAEALEQRTYVPQPGYRYSQLENGLRICSVDKGGEVASVGLHVHAGSRFDSQAQPGVAHMCELMSYRSTAHLSQLRIGKSFEVMGVDADCSVGRETLGYRATFLRDSLPYVVPVLVGNVLYPRLVRWEVASCHKRIAAAQKSLYQNVDDVVEQHLHAAAYHNNTLGQPLYATNKSTEYFTEDTIREYMLDNFAPARQILVGVNVDHDELSKWAMRSYVDYNPIPLKERSTAAPQYTGGESEFVQIR